MAPIVNIAPGRLEGDERGGIQVFRGIPYAQPPREGLRWRPPQPLELWSGVRNAKRFGASSPQLPATVKLVQSAIGVGESRQSQDCLYLNVWTPACDGARRPVMVWIHGGAFVMGSGAARLYDGADLARRGDVVVVTLNYRLGALGFLDARLLPGDAVANAGLRDQIAALEWVRDHIDSFGGDPENVTVFGESAGGMSVGTLLGTPAAQGLFHRAICQSGAAHNASTPAKARRAAELFLEELGIDDLAGLEAAKTSEILAAQRRTAMALGLEHGVLPWQPCVDDDVLPLPPLETIAKGLSRDVPTLVGTNRHEWRLFMLGDRKGAALDEEGLGRRLARALPGSDAFGVALARRAALAYGEMEGRHLERPRDRWEAFQSDRIFHHPAHRLAATQQQHAKTFAYQFSYMPPGPGRRIGACHGIEIPFVFGTLRAPVLRPLLLLAYQARRVSNQMQRAWVSFARSGDPGHDDLPDWPTYGSDAATLRITRRCRIENDPFGEGVRFWSEVEDVQREQAA